MWALGIEKYFKFIVYTEQLGREGWKPSPAGLEKIMQTLKGKPENMAYIADNEKKNFIAPNKLGVFNHPDNPPCPHTQNRLRGPRDRCTTYNRPNQPIIWAFGETLRLYFPLSAPSQNRADNRLSSPSLVKTLLYQLFFVDSEGFRVYNTF